MNFKAKRMTKKARIEMEKEIMHILATTDYSNYDIAVYYDEERQIAIVPKPVYALSLVDSNVAAWMYEMVESFHCDEVHVV